MLLVSEEVIPTTATATVGVGMEVGFGYVNSQLSHSSYVIRSSAPRIGTARVGVQCRFVCVDEGGKGVCVCV